MNTITTSLHTSFVSSVKEQKTKREEMIQESVEVSKTRAEEIKEAIKNGTYKIDLEKTTKAIVEELM